MDKKWTHVLFAFAGIILAWLLTKCGEWGWSYFGKPNTTLIGLGAFALAAVVTYVAWKNEVVFGLATEVTSELAKVTWPTRKETMTSTIVVIVTTIIASAFLGLFDTTWSWATRLIYG
jgi:preprotein translocase SecE subunit